MMTTRKGLSHFDAMTPHERAGEYLIARDAGRLSASDQRAFDAWLDERPAHRRAFEDVEAVLSLTTETAAHPQMLRLRSEALSAEVSSHRWPVAQVASAAAAALLLASGVFVAKLGNQHSPMGDLSMAQATSIPALATATTYKTLVGDRSKVRLPDGSVATLDTDSVIKIDFASRERNVWLLKGQALFDVAKNKAVPFQVYAEGRRVTAVGTRFNVRLRPRGVEVALVEGIVQVAQTQKPSAAAPSDALTMAAGELLDAREGHPVQVVPADMTRYISWEAGLLVFKDEPLASAVREVNRYSVRPIMLSGVPGRFRVTGVFKTAEPERFATMMTEAFPLTLTSEGGQRFVLKPR